MNLQFGSQTFSKVQIPLLWGSRAVVGHVGLDVLSIIDLAGDAARPEIVGDIPWTGIEFSSHEDGFIIFSMGVQSFFYSPVRKMLRDLRGGLPECQIASDHLRIGGGVIKNSTVIGCQVGVGVTEQGFFIGGPLPPGLAKLVV